MPDTITIKGEKELLAKLNKLSKLDAKDVMRSGGLNISGKMQIYPPQPPTTYQRTNQLRDNWKVTPKRTEVKIENRTSYAGYVQGDDTQAYVHKLTGWQTLVKTAEQSLDEFVKLLKKQVDRILA